MSACFGRVLEAPDVRSLGSSTISIIIAFSDNLILHRALAIPKMFENYFLHHYHQPTSACCNTLPSLCRPNLQKIKNEEDFNFILSIIPNVTIILRHIWTMSNYYSKDRNMLNLLGQISYVFAEKVKILINVDTIFK